jgi:hypothetical protein
MKRTRAGAFTCADETLAHPIIAIATPAKKHLFIL